MVDALRLSTLRDCAPLIFGILAQSLELRNQSRASSATAERAWIRVARQADAGSSLHFRSTVTAWAKMRFSHYLLTSLLLWASSPAFATDIVACIVASLPNNRTYFGTATTATKLKCEFTNENYFPTLPELYRQGWRVIQVLGAEQAISSAGQGASPLYLLERETQAAPATSSATPSASQASKPDRAKP